MSEYMTTVAAATLPEGGEKLDLYAFVAWLVREHPAACVLALLVVVAATGIPTLFELIRDRLPGDQGKS